jgi:hypothetical protein
LIIAAEVDESIYPQVLKLSSQNILKFNFPISVYVICPLEVFQADAGLKNSKELREHGFGLITVDDRGAAHVQDNCIPLAQHISESELEAQLKEEYDGCKLTANLKVAFRTAHKTFVVNEGQGLQAAGQIIEAIVNRLTECSIHAGYVAANIAGSSAADKIDALYGLPRFKNHRAALGGTRGFVRAYRNAVSHPTRTPQQAVRKIRQCRDGFFEAIRQSKNLYKMAKHEKFRLNLNLT